MAILGFHLVLSLIAASVLQKICPRYSFARWLICGKLFRYVHPTNNDLRSAMSAEREAVNGIARGTKKRPNTKAQKLTVDNESFNVPKHIDIPLESVIIRPLDLVALPYYSEYRWLIDCSVVTVAVYICCELFAYLLPIMAAKDLNLGVVWLLVLLSFSLKTLASVTALYFRNSDDQSGEKALCLTFGAAGFLSSMVLFLVDDENVLELGLRRAFQNFTVSSAAFLKSQDIEFGYSRTPIMLYFVLSVFFGLLSGLLAFPSLRHARMFLDAIRYAANNPLQKALLYLSFLSPLIALLMFCKPLARNRLVFSDDPLLTSAQFDCLRFWVLISVVVLKLAVLRSSLQAYLNLALERMDNIKREAGRINNLELQRMIARIFHYLCVVAVQYCAPVLLILCYTLLLKTLGQYSWLSLVRGSPWCLKQLASMGIFLGPEETISTTDFSQSHLPSEIAVPLAHLAQLFPVVVQRGLWSVALFWTGVLYFAMSVVGVVYYTRFASPYI